MKLQYVYDVLMYSELKELSIFDKLNSSNSEVVELARRQVLNYINLGILEIHKHLPIKVEESEITLSEDRHYYYLLDSSIGDYLTSLPGEVLHILAVYDKEGAELPLNDSTYDTSIYTPAYNKIQVTNPIDGDKLYVAYQASEAPIPYTDTLMDRELNISPALLDTLVLFVGYKLHTGTDGSIQDMNNTYFVRYNQSLQNMKTQQSLVYRISNKRDTLEDKGFK